MTVDQASDPEDSEHEDIERYNGDDALVVPEEDRGYTSEDLDLDLD